MDNKAKLSRKIITVFLLFLFACVVGWIYEMIFYKIDTGAFIKRGQGFGPWLPIYGLGALLLLLITSKRKFSPVSVFLISGIGSGVLESVVGWALFHFGNGLRLWDYNNEIWNWGNIGGYVCLRSLLIFAILGTLFYYFVVPTISSLTTKAKTTTLTVVTVPLAVLFFADLIFAYFIKPIFLLIG